MIPSARRLRRVLGRHGDDNLAQLRAGLQIPAMDRGDIEEARRWHRKLFPLCRDMLSLATNPIPIKAAMKLLGRDPGDLRLPMTPLEDAGMVKLKKTLAEYGLL